VKKLLGAAALLASVVAGAAGACGGTAASPPVGGLRQACYGNSTCNAGLTCASDICVVFGDGGAGVGPGASSGATDSGAKGETGSTSSGAADAGTDALGPEASAVIDSCLSWKFSGATTDGNYTISIGGQSASVWCHGMATSSPAEYLNLPAGSNYSTYIDHCSNESTTVVTFIKVRLDLSPLAIDRTDITFATIAADGGAATSDARLLRYAIGGACDSADLGPTAAVVGEGQLDLSGTGFQLAVGDMFVATGYMPSCMATISPNGLTATLLGGGYSGWCDVPPIDASGPVGSSTLPVVLVP
jgi:hypothetical protein